MKKTIISVLTISLALGSLSVFADNRNDDVKVPMTPVISNVHVESENDHENDSDNDSKHKEKKQGTNLSHLQSRGIKLIRERLSALNSNKKAIEKSKLTVEQKSAIFSLIDSNIAGLNIVKIGLASSTDATSTKALVESIYTQFRIYGIVIPQVRLEKRINDLQNHVTKLSETFVKVQMKITEHKGKGKDVTVWQKNLDDSRLLVASDTSRLSALLIKAQALKPIDYGTSSKMIIDSINMDLKSIAKDFNSIQKNLHKPQKLGNATTSVAITSATTTQ